MSKRKLDLDCLIDQIPDKEFIAIKKSNTSLLAEAKASGKSDRDRRKSSESTRKRAPLTEHQKEVRKQRSFIPLEVQSVFSADSQSAFTLDEDTNTQSNFCVMPSAKGRKYFQNRLFRIKMHWIFSHSEALAKEEAKPKQAESEEQRLDETKSIVATKDDSSEEVYEEANETCEKMDVDVTFQAEKSDSDQINPSQVPNEQSTEELKTVETMPSIQSTTTFFSFNQTPTKASVPICFHSKKNPEKQIQLIEVSIAPPLPVVVPSVQAPVETPKPEEDKNAEREERVEVSSEVEEKKTENEDENCIKEKTENIDEAMHQSQPESKRESQAQQSQTTPDELANTPKRRSTRLR